MVATAGVAEDQVPPVTVEESVVVPFEQMAVVPESVPLEGYGVIVNTKASETEVKPVTVMVRMTVPLEISELLGVYVVIEFDEFKNVPDPEDVHKTVPLFEIPLVVNELPAQIVASDPAFELGEGLSLSMILTKPEASKIDAFTGSESVIFIVSVDSMNESSMMGIVKVFIVSPGEKFKVPVTLVKSIPDVAVPFDEV
jgi:hypothetical protein